MSIKRSRRPTGVIAYCYWRADHLDPTLPEWLERYEQVGEAVERYRRAGLRPKAAWLVELLGAPIAAQLLPWLKTGKAIHGSV